MANIKVMDNEIGILKIPYFNYGEFATITSMRILNREENKKIGGKR